MQTKAHAFSLVVVCLIGALAALAQEAPAPEAATKSSSETVVPRLIQFSGVVKDATGKVATGRVTVTFSLYELQDGGLPLGSGTLSRWMSKGATRCCWGRAPPSGVPLDLFTTGQARWLGAAPTGVDEQPRVLLVGVPYALKAADADTLGGKPASAYVTADSQAAACSGLGLNSGRSPGP